MSAVNMPQAEGRAERKRSVDWRRVVEPYTGPNAQRATLQVITTLVPLALTMWAAHLALAVSPWLALTLAPVIAGLLVRTFIIMHDCAHNSFYETRWLNDGTGFITGVITLTPFLQWRRDHALHHASSGDLDRRGHGDVPTLTVREYQARSPRGRMLYRLIRHPMLLLLGGPIHLALNQRFRPRSKATGATQVSNVWMTNIGIAGLLAAAVLLVGWRSVVFAYLLPFYFAAMAGVWLFYVQHQFEDAYWVDHKEWDYLESALKGSSHLKLHPILQWFTGSIGLHHVHHVAPRIPNFRLQSCHDENPLFQNSPVVTMASGMSALRLSLWDEESRRMISFRDLEAKDPR
jgi:omega-6 fatty acid desaturase (delta-12 desaturase)